MSATPILDRLDKVKQTGTGRWIASCPAHEDKSPSLSIRELDDGRVLLHDFGCCDVSDVLAALGLEMTDLFPEPLDHHFKPTRSRIPASDRLELIDHEVMTVGLMAAKFMESRTLAESEWERFALAVSRIGKARCHGQH